MRKLGVVCLTLVMAFGLATAADAQIKWEQDLQASITKDKSEKKPILMYFYNPK